MHPFDRFMACAHLMSPIALSDTLRRTGQVYAMSHESVLTDGGDAE